MKKVILVVLLLLVTCASGSVTYPEGYVNDAGYTYKGGFWYWPDGRAYIRYQAPYYNCGRQYYYWHYQQVAIPVVQATLTSADPEWRTRLLEIAATRDKYELKARAATLEHNIFLEATKALNLSFGIQGYGQPLLYPQGMGLYQQQAAPFLSQYGASGQTIYAYNSIADLYGNTDLNALYLQAARLTQNAQTLAGQAHSEFSDLTGREGMNRARVAEILAKGQSAALASKAIRDLLEPTPHAIVQNKGVAVVPSPKIGGDLTSWAKAAQKCVECHTPVQGKVSGGFDIAQYPSMSPEQKANVLMRINSNDPKIRMPKNAPPLTPLEKKLFSDL